MSAAFDLAACAAELSSVELFGSLDGQRLADVAAICTPVKFHEGEHFIEEGGDASCFFILLEGTVKVMKKLKLPLIKPLQAEERILTQLSGAEKPVLGETALLGETQRRSSVVCVTPCRLYRIEAGAMRELLSRDAVTGRQIYSQLSAMLYRRLEQANSDVVKLSAALVFALEE